MAVAPGRHHQFLARRGIACQRGDHAEGRVGIEPARRRAALEKRAAGIEQDQRREVLVREADGVAAETDPRARRHPRPSRRASGSDLDGGVGVQRLDEEGVAIDADPRVPGMKALEAQIAFAG